MNKPVTELVDLVAQAGPAPEGVDQIDFIIASLPGEELTHSAKNLTFSYEGLAAAVREDPTLLDRLHKTPLPEKSLADDILVRQQELSRPRRRLATLAAVIALGGAGFGIGFKTDKDVQHQVFGPRQSTTAPVKPGGTSEAIEAGAIIGGAAGIVGGFVVSLAGLSLSGRLARRPAQKVVDQARISGI